MGTEALVLMATEPETFRTSQALASALGTNAVVVRRLLSALRRSGIVASAKGPTGGSHLARSPKQITLRDVYRSLAGGSLLHRGSHESAETKEIRKAMQSIFRKAEKSLEEELNSITLNQLIKKAGRKAAKSKARDAAQKTPAEGPLASSAGAHQG